MRNFWLCVLLLGIIRGCQSAWIPLRVGNTSWLSVQEKAPGREFWLRPECSLESSRPKDCDSEWSVTIRFWSWPQLAQAERSLRRTRRCNSIGPCFVHPFQTQRLKLRDQRSHWLHDKIVFINGPLPQTVNFRLRPLRSGQRRKNCSFQADNLVVEMRSGDPLLQQNGQEPFTFGSQHVKRALDALRRSMASFPAGGPGTNHLAQTLLQMTGLNPHPTVAKRIETELASWAASQSGLSFSPWQREQNVSVFNLFAKYPKTRKFAVSTAVSGIPLQRFSVVFKSKGEITEAKSYNKTRDRNERKVSDRQQYNDAKAAVERSINEAAMTMLRRRITNLESLVSSLTRNASKAPVKSRKTLIKQVQVQPAADRNLVANFDDCREIGKRNLSGSPFYHQSLKRYVRCSPEGELIVLYRSKGNVNFNRTFAEYRKGFGNAMTGDYWLGLDFLANYTRNSDVCARIILKPWRLSTHSVQYADFAIAGVAKNFRLSYTKYRGNGVKDALLVNRGQAFSTYDRDVDAFVGNCAQIFGGGGWYKSCTKANIFGKQKVMTDRGMCWQGVDSSQGEMCSPLTGLTLSVKKVTEGVGKEIVFSSVANRRGSNCVTKVQEIVINATTRYTLQAAGAPGGNARYTGGRGALIRTELFLSKGTRLRIAVGCRGGTGYSNGHGGDATFVTDFTTKRLLLVAGGGGGGAAKANGLNGRSGKKGGIANDINVVNTVPISRIRSRGGLHKASGWKELKSKFFALRKGQVVKSGRRVRSRQRLNRYRYDNSNVWGGGGGGGYEGGYTGSDANGAGGGGGSYCAALPGTSCEIEEGGNYHNTGYFILEKQACF